jgi:hypothetical protein
MQQHHVRSYDVLLPSSLFTNLRLHMLPPPLRPCHQQSPPGRSGIPTQLVDSLKHKLDGTPLELTLRAALLFP